ncbi:MAG: hypothetical protein K6C94_08015 [Candidatus Gastranaerophilales bacterium]|nr:hypothetical protein [Candidatus Gastranaerophilales bacterium]
MKIFKILVLFLVVLFFSGCANKKAGILFNKHPLTEQTIYDYTDILDVGKRIYYVIVMPKKVESRYIDIQVIKKDNDYGKYGYNLIWTRTVRLKDEEVNYFTDYFVLNQKGYYIMKVYSKDNPHNALVFAEFYVQ